MARPGKTFNVRCAADQAAHLAQALTHYAYAAYPEGGSECAQVARETLLTSAQTIAEHAASDRGAELSRRQRVMIKAGVEWYFSDQGPGDPGLQQDLLALLPGGRDQQPDHA